MYNSQRYTVTIRATTPTGTATHTIVVYASSDAEATEHATDELTTYYPGIALDVDVLSIQSRA